MAIFGKHIGAWGTPDFGITEAIGKALGSKTTYQGGSNIIPNEALNDKGQAVKQDPNSGRVLSEYRDSKGNLVQQGPAPAPAPKNTTQTSGGGSQQNNTPPPPQQPANINDMNPAQRTDWARSQGYDGWDHYQDEMRKRAEQSGNTKESDMNPAQRTDWARSQGYDGWDHYQDEMRKRAEQSGNTKESDAQKKLFDEINSMFDSYLGGLGQYQQEGIGNIQNTANTQKQGIRDQEALLLQNYTTDRGQLEDMQAKTLADLAKNLRGQVTNVGRFIGSRGAGNSSATDQASAYLNKAFGTGRANVMSSYAQQFNDLAKTETGFKAKVAEMINGVDTWANSAINDISNQYNQLRANASLMKGQARIDAIQQLQSQLHQVQQQRDQYRMAIESEARNRLAQLNNMKLELQQSAQFDPREIVQGEYGFNPSDTFNRPEEYYYNPMALLRRREDEF